MKKKEDNKNILDLAGRMTAKQIILLREELDIEDEMNEEETKELDDDPYFLLAQRLANAPQVKVNTDVREEGEVMPGAPELNEEDRRCPVCNIKDDNVISHFKKFHPGTFRSFDFEKEYVFFRI